MRFIIYGADFSGEVGFKLLQFLEYETVCFIDKKVGLGKGNKEGVPIYPKISAVPSSMLEEVDRYLICVGNKDSAEEIKSQLSLQYSIELDNIQTIHDKKYNMLYSSIVEIKKRIQKHPLLEDGWFVSNEEQSSVDRDCQPVPWYTYPCIDFLKKRIKKSFQVFEYGSGNSTLWWADKVQFISSVEHDKEWYEAISTKVSNMKNVKITYVDVDSSKPYSNIIFDNQKVFDIVIIDGIDRINCARNAVKVLNDAGVIIFDNSDREEYYSAFQYLNEHGFKRLDFVGCGPINSYKWSTSIFYRSNNCLQI